MRYALGAYVASAVAANGIGAALWFGAGVSVAIPVGILIVDAALIATLFPLWRRRGLSAMDLGLRWAPAGRATGLAVLGLISISVFNELAFQTLRPRHTGNPFAGVQHDNVLLLALTAFAAAISAPVTEEIFFRGLIYRSLRNRLSVAPAAIVSALLFGAVHALSHPASSLPGIAFAGLVFALLYEWTGSLLPGMALHSFIDASAFEITVRRTNSITLLSFVGLLAILSLRALVRRWQYRRAAVAEGRSAPRVERAYYRGALAGVILGLVPLAVPGKTAAGLGGLALVAAAILYLYGLWIHRSYLRTRDLDRAKSRVRLEWLTKPTRLRLAAWLLLSAGCLLLLLQALFPPPNQAPLGAGGAIFWAVAQSFTSWGSWATWRRRRRLAKSRETERTHGQVGERTSGAV